MVDHMVETSRPRVEPDDGELNTASFDGRLVAYCFGDLDTCRPFCASAQASDYEVGATLVCDKQEQVERFTACSRAMQNPPSGSRMPRRKIPPPARS
jgi:hypothetical protein